MGRSTNQIAADLHLAPETVGNHVRSLLKALGARSRLEATLVALRDGLVSFDADRGDPDGQRGPSRPHTD